MSVYQSIQDSLARLFNSLLPDFDILFEKTKVIEEHELENYVFIELQPIGNQTFSADLTTRSVFVDAAIHESSESNAHYRELAARIDAKLCPVFRFEDRAITVPDVSYKIVDCILHCSFTLTFTTAEELPVPNPVMGELSFQIERA